MSEYQVYAALGTQAAVAINLCMTPAFWYMFGSMFKNYSWHGIDLFLRLHMTTLHSLPLIGTLLNVLITDIKFVKKDWNKMMWLGQIYMVFNFVGQFSYGTPLYAITDWVNNPI